MRSFAATKNEPLCKYTILSKDTCTCNLPSVNQMSVKNKWMTWTDEFLWLFFCKWVGKNLNHPAHIYCMCVLFETKWVVKNKCSIPGCQLSVRRIHFAEFTKAQQNDKLKFWFLKETSNTLLRREALIFPEEYSWHRPGYTEYCIPRLLLLIMHDDRRATLYTCERTNSNLNH